MKDTIFEELEYGFQYGDAIIERLMSDEKRGWVIIGLNTSKTSIQIYVTKKGKVRITDENGLEWLPNENYDPKDDPNNSHDIIL